MNINRKRILYVIPSLRTGAAEKHVVSVASHIDKTRFEPHVVALLSAGDLGTQLAEHRIPVHALSARTTHPSAWLRPIAHLIRIMRLVRLLLQLRPDVVHAYLPVANVYAAAATLATAGRARLIVSKRALCGYKKGRPVLAAAERAANRIADRILVNSNAVADAVAHVEGAPADKMRTIYNGVDAVTFRSNRERGILRREFGLPEDSRLVVTVSNLRSVKGLDDFVEAARSVCEEHPNVRFAFVGRDDGEGVRLRRQAVELGIESALLFAGARRDVPEVLADADLLVQPSLSEGFSNVVLEGMAAGKPVVATDVGGNPEAIEDGVTGLLVPPRRPDILASAINRVLDDPQLSASLGEAAQRKVLQSFTIELMIHNMESLYDELLGRRECDGRDRC